MLKYTAKYWRSRAEEVRRLPTTIASEEAREILAEIARDYERLANMGAERRRRNKARAMAEAERRKVKNAINTLMERRFTCVRRR